MTRFTGFTLRYLHFYMTGPTEFFMEIIFTGGQLYDVNDKGASPFAVLMTFSTLQLFLVLVVRKNHCTLFPFHLIDSLQIYCLGSFTRQYPGGSRHKGKG